MLLNKYRGFTLAELMIVFTVIGIIAALLAPVLFSVSPNTPELKAKKAYNTFVRAVESLTNGEPYESNDGILDATPFIAGSGNAENDANDRRNFFCNNLASLLNTRSSNCNVGLPRELPGRMNLNGAGFNFNGNEAVNIVRCDDNECPQILHFGDFERGGVVFNNAYDYVSLQNSLDSICENYIGALSNAPDFRYNIITSDNVGWTVQKYDFSNNVSHLHAGVTTSTFYAAVCVNTSNDISAAGNRDDLDYTHVYSMGVNRDGKVLAGTKLQRLIDEDFTEAAN